MKTVASLVIDRLAEAGVGMLFGMPGGGSNLDMIEAAGARGLPFVLSHTESAGALMAAAQAEITGRPGACLSTLGPGVASIVNGTAHAFLDRVPLFVLTDGPPGPRESGFEHQRLDHHALLGPVTRWSAALTPERAAETMAVALAAAMGPPRGPVHLDCAAGVAPGRAGTGTPDRAAGTRPFACANTLRRAISPELDGLLKRSRRPLLIVGLGGRRDPDARSIRAFCERHGVPALVTYKAKGVIPDDHALFAGLFTNGAIEAPTIEEADLILAVGLDPVELLARRWPYAQPVVCCSTHPLAGGHVPVSTEVIGEIAAILECIGERLPQSLGWIESAIRAHADRQREALRWPADGLAPSRAIEILAGVVPAGTRLTVDAGAHMFPAMGLWPARAPGEVLISNGLSTMGFALPAAIGAALLERGQPVVALTGDGGLLMCAGELRTAAREQLRIRVVVFEDEALSLIKIKQDGRGYRPSGVAVGPMDWPALSAAVGVAGWRAESETELERCLAQAMACDGPALIAARIDSSGYGNLLRAVRG